MLIYSGISEGPSLISPGNAKTSSSIRIEPHWCPWKGKPFINLKYVLQAQPLERKSNSFSPKVSSTQNGGTEPYSRLFWGVGFPLHKPYIHTAYVGFRTSILGTCRNVGCFLNHHDAEHPQDIHTNHAGNPEMWWWKIPAMPSWWKISSPLVKMYINVNIYIYMYAPAKTNALIPKVAIFERRYIKKKHQVYKPFRKRTYPTKREKENHRLKSAFWEGIC